MPGEHADIVRAPNVTQLADLVRPVLAAEELAVARLAPSRLYAGVPQLRGFDLVQLVALAVEQRGLPERRVTRGRTTTSAPRRFRQWICRGPL
jgi:hypothetical protein